MTSRDACVLLLVMLCSGAAAGSRPADLASEPDVRGGFQLLLQHGSLHMSRMESAAFVVSKPAGGFGFVEWPASEIPDTARWEGPYPADVVAIAHTHPNWLPEPSRLDAAVARRTRLPVYVITRGRVSRTDGTFTEVVTPEAWEARR